MLLHRSQDSEATLVPLIIVVVYVVFNHCYELITAGEALAVIPFSLQDPPEAFHRTIVDTLGYSGHTLSHAGFFQFCMEYPIGVLESAV